MARQRTRLDNYADRYEHVDIVRGEDGVLHVTLHSDGGSLVWTQALETELADAFTDIAGDPDNAAVLLTGTGSSFCSEIDFDSFQLQNAADWAHIIEAGQRLLESAVAIDVPVVAAINGPARIHSEIALLADVVVAADHTTFQDTHFVNDVVPGDGGHAIWRFVLGPQRGRYFLLTGQEIPAAQALDWGVVNEVLPLGDLVPRAQEIAASIATRSPAVRRYSRSLLTRDLKRILADEVAMGLTHEALAALAGSVARREGH